VALRFKFDRFDVAGLFDENGSTIIVHALADNYANIPTRYRVRFHDHLESGGHAIAG
jgi:Cu/Zn superoxide dismutase